MCHDSADVVFEIDWAHYLKSFDKNFESTARQTVANYEKIEKQNVQRVHSADIVRRR